MKRLGVPLPYPPPPPGRDSSSSQSYLQAVSSIFPDNSPLTLLLQGGERLCESFITLNKNAKLHNSRSFPVRLRQK